MRLPAFVRGSRTLDSVPDTRGALARALWSVGGSHSQLSLYVTAGNRERSRRCADTMYMCFSALGPAELLSTGSTMLPEDRHGRNVHIKRLWQDTEAGRIGHFRVAERDGGSEIHAQALPPMACPYIVRARQQPDYAPAIDEEEPR